MSRIEKLTAAQEARLVEFRDEWLAHGLSTEPADRKRAETALDAMYAAAKLPRPSLRIWLRSPLEGAIGSVVLGQIKGTRKTVGAQVGDQVRAQVGDQVRDQVGDQVWAQVRDQVRDQVGDQVGDQVRDQVWDQVWAQVGDQVWDQVWDQVRDQVGARVWAQVSWYCGYGLHDANWLAWLDYFERVVALKFTVPITGLLESGRSCGWYWPYAGAVLFTERPNRLRRDDQNRLHSDDGAAIRYPDGWGIWAWHGVRVPREVIEQPESLKPSDVLKEANAEVRRVMVERLGVDRFLTGVKAKVRHEDTDNLGHRRRLLTVAQPQDEELVAVEVTNSTREPDGTWKSYILRVPPTMRSCAEAVAWTFDLSEKEYQPAMES